MAITYAPTTNFGLKDSLPTNDSDKVIRGSEFTTEFTAIQTAFSLAAPNASPTFTGTVTIPTADINGGAIDGTVIGGASAAAGTFTNLTASGTVSFSGATISNGGTVTTVDINGGNIDGTVIGAATPAAGSFTTGQFGTSLNVDGTVTADGLTVDGSVNVNGTVGDIFKIATTAGNADLWLTDTDTSAGQVRVRGDANSLKFITDTKVRHTIASNGDISFYEDTGTTPKFFWDASAESLNIGNGSARGGPNTNLITAKSSGTNYLEVQSGSTDSTGLLFSDGNSGNYGLVQYAHSGDYLQFYTAAAERMRIDSSGNVGIGTTSPSEKFELYGTNPAISIYADSASGRSDLFFRDSGGASGRLRYDHASDYLAIFTVGSEAMRIDSSGNLLVGKTSVDLSTDGFEARTGGTTLATVTGGPPLYLNRKSSDGTIVDLRKDGTTVGQINAFAGAIVIGGPTSGIFFNGNGMEPTSGGNTRVDGTENIGAASYRFKDLYLSGGVYLGGTAAANLLDDYEEGTWTPALGGTWTSNPTSLEGSYTKIGRIVTVYLKFVGGTKTGTGTGYFTGLPFATTIFGTGSVIDSGLNDKGAALAANTDRVWVADTSFPATNYISITYWTT